MKALGMSLIVFGHVADAATLGLTPPIYPKQFGVVLFLFAAGFVLARDRRSPPDALFTRLFPVYLFGIAFAIVMTVKGMIAGPSRAWSNYLPFVGGANVVFDNFPANPTTWYLGTYLHLLLLWAFVLRRIRIRPWMIVAAVLIEIPIRALLIDVAGRYVAYMLFTNWIAVFLLGLARGGEADPPARQYALPYVVALAGGIGACGMVMRAWGVSFSFPFMTLDGWSSTWGVMTVSAAASLLYVATAALVFAATRHLAAPAPAAVRFIARNSLVIFLVHMPVYWSLHPVLVGWGLAYWPRVAIQLLVCVLGLGLVSEVVMRIVEPDRLRARVFEACSAGNNVWKKETITA